MVKSVLIRISTQEIIKKSNYPSIEIIPIESLEADLKWLIVNKLDRPVFDPAIEKIERVEEITTDKHPLYDLDQYRISFNIIDLSEQEKAEYIQEQEDLDESSNTQSQHKIKGIIGFDRAMSLIQRKLDNGVLTINQAKTLSQGLYPVLEPLYKGMWRLVKQNFNNTTPPTNQVKLNVFNKIKNKVNSYVSNNY